MTEHNKLIKIIHVVCDFFWIDPFIRSWAETWRRVWGDG